MNASQPVLADTLARLARFQLHLQVTTNALGVVEGYWLESEALKQPEQVPLSALLAKFGALGFAPNKRAAAASLLLRLGWASGFAVGAYMACRRVPFTRDFALQFSPRTLLHRLAVRDCVFAGEASDPLAGAPDWARIVDPDGLRRALLDSLLAFSEPVVAAQREWSGFSRHALWSMVTSSWAAQFASIARQLGEPQRGIEEVEALLALTPELKRSAPELYEVRVGEAASTCQKRAACCLYFKSPGRPFCASCPILPETERLERNRAFVAQQKPLA